MDFYTTKHIRDHIKTQILYVRHLKELKLDHIKLFHTDRGNEFKNKIIDEVLETFRIQRSLSMKVCHYDNAVAEVTL